MRRSMGRVQAPVPPWARMYSYGGEVETLHPVSQVIVTAS